MSFIQLAVNIDAKTADKLSDIFIDLGALSVSIEDQHTGTELEQAIFNEPGMQAPSLWNESRLIVLFAENTDIQAITDKASSILAHAFSYTTEIIADQDWVTLTQNQFNPIKIKDNFYIVPSWHTSPDSHAINITLDPGLAFGTGSHPTTFMCLEWIANNIGSNTSSLLDYGCGSGILAIAAKKFGANLVYGVDIDQQAITSSINNSSDNNVEIKYCTPDSLPDIKFEIVVANILSNPLRILAPVLSSLTQRKLILSGILEDQADELSEIYSHWFHVKIAKKIDGWVLLECSNIINNDSKSL